MAGLPALNTVIADKYRLDAILGRGGMGVVYRAQHLVIERGVALKVLHPALCESEDARMRFLREARAAARIQHNNIVQVFDAGMHEGALFIAMELVEGKSLETLLAEEALSLAERLRLVLACMRGVAAAHEGGVIHRDIKPDNIVVGRPDRDGVSLAKVIDFGISKLASGPSTDEGQGTKTGTTIGTPGYMSFEQATNAKEVDARSDVYSFAALLYRAFTDALPYDGDTIGAIIVQMVSTRPAPPSALNPALPRALDAILLQGLECDRERRFQTLDALIEALTPVLAQLEGRLPAEQPATPEREDTASRELPAAHALAPSLPPERPSRTRITALALALALCAGAALWALRSGSPHVDLGAAAASARVAEKPAPPVQHDEPRPAAPAISAPPTSASSQVSPTPALLPSGHPAQTSAAKPARTRRPAAARSQSATRDAPPIDPPSAEQVPAPALSAPAESVERSKAAVGRRETVLRSDQL